MSFKALRRSRDTKATHISTPLTGNPILSRPASAKTFTPQKVIRALDSRRATAPQELSFSKGDFFYVIKELELPPSKGFVPAIQLDQPNSSGLKWYEAHNPISGARGLVPAIAFEEMSKQSAPPRTSMSSIDVVPASKGALAIIPSVPRAPAAPRHQTFYAIVQYDFVAERPDELDAKAGEPISVVAQSNREWLVAKPIGRLGGPGLIPVTFVEIRDPSSGRKMSEDEVSALMDRGNLPKVEEWKKATMDYKASSIPLGVIDSGPSVPNSPYAPAGFASTPDQQDDVGASLRDSVQSGFVEPYGQEEPDILPPGLLIAASIPSFHRESGEYWFRLNVEYQPDPVPPADPQPAPITMVLYRNYDDFYAFQLELLDTWPVEAGRQKRDPDGPELTENDRILPYMPGPVDHVDDAVTATRQRDLDIYVKELVDLHIRAEYVLRCDLVRRFLAQKPGDVILPPVQDASRSMDGVKRGVGGLRVEHDGYESADQRRRSGDSSYSDDRGPAEATATFPSRNIAPQDRTSYSSYAPSQSSPTRSSPNTTYSNHARSPTASSVVLSSADIGTSGSPAYLKVKIFHSSTDDLIAIRVPVRVTYQQLLAKVKDRLGSDVHKLKYRESAGSSLTGKSLTTIEGDDGLKEWVANNEKLVLYAY